MISSENPQESSDRGLRSPALGILIIGIICIVTYFRTLSSDFIWYDDQVHIFQDDLLNPITFHNFTKFWTEPFAGLYIPVSYTAFTLLALIARLPHSLTVTEIDTPYNPHIFHAANLILHIVNSAILYLILRKTTKNQLGSILGTLIFSIHPLQVESVAWISELRGLLCSTFGLLATAVYSRMKFASPETEKLDKKQRVRNLAIYLLSTLLYVLSIFSKPTGVIFVLLTPILCAAMSGKWRAKQAFHFAPWLAMAIALAFFTRTLQAIDVSAATSPLERLFIAPDTILFYMGKLFYPLHLMIDYGYTPTVAMHNPHIIEKMNIFIAVAIAFFVLHRWFPWLTRCALITLIVLAPNSGIIPFSFQYYSTVADRYMYLALIGPALAVAEITSRTRFKLFPIIPVCAIAIFCVLSFQRASLWKNTMSLMSEDYKSNPQSVLVLVDIGNYYLGKEDYNTAIAYYKATIKSRPNLARGYYDLANAYLAIGDPFLAMRNYLGALQNNPVWVEASIYEGESFLELGRPWLAMSSLQKAKSLKNDAENLHFYMGNVYQLLGRYKQAKAEYDIELAQYQDYVPLYINAGYNLRSLGEAAAGNAMIAKAQKLETSKAVYYTYLAKVERLRGNYPAMKKDLATALKINPHLNLALGEKRSFDVFMSQPKEIAVRDREMFERQGSELSGLWATEKAPPAH